MKRFYCYMLSLFVLSLSAVAFGASGAVKTGTIKGTVTFGGRPTADIVASVEGVSQEAIKARIAELASKKAVMDQREVRFIPRVLPVLVGTAVDFPNNDTSWHNVYSASDVKPFDLGLYAPKKTRSVTFDKPAAVRILCNVHPNMEGFIIVKDHPYFSGADSRGNYRLNAVPLGSYRLAVWHPDVGTVEVAVELVREGQVLDLNFDLKKR
jgi:plastocyanin